MITQHIKSIWIITISFLTTVSYCGFVIIDSCFKKRSREGYNHIIQQWSDYLLNRANITYDIINPHNILPPTNKPVIMMVNHTSAYDIPLSFKVFPNHAVRMLAKKELSRIPLMGSGMKIAEFLFIDRKNKQQAIKDLNHVKALMRSGIIMWISPEGTRSLDGKLRPLKKGAFITAIQAEAIIIPVGIRGAMTILSKKGLLLQTGMHTSLHVGQPIDASQYTMENKDALIETVSQSLKQLTGELSS